MNTGAQLNSRTNPERTHQSGRGTSLNIKNAETTRLVQELAALKGVSLVVAVTEAVREDLARERAERDAANVKKKSRYELLMEFAEECAPLFTDGRTANELINDLYDDETGLPK